MQRPEPIDQVNNVPMHPIKILFFGVIGFAAIIFLAAQDVIPLLWAAVALIIILILGQILRMQHSRYQRKMNQLAEKSGSNFLATILIIVEAALAVVALLLNVPALVVLVVGLALSLATYRLIG